MIRRAIVILLTLGLAACAGGGAGSSTAGAPDVAASSTPASSASAEQSGPPNPCDTGVDFAEVPAGATCWVEPNAETASAAGTAPVRVFYTIPAEGWSAFIGTFKDVGRGEALQRVNVLMASITNVTVDACTEQVALDPRIGPTVDDLATALTLLPPFEVVSPPSDVTAFGYSGKHVEIMVPADQPAEGTGGFSGCRDGALRTWIGRPLSFAFYGYVAPGDTEEFWILDVEGSRIVITALRTANASAELLAEQQEILDSIVIEP